MADVFTVLAKDHEEVKRMLAELEKGPTKGTGASEDQLALRKKMTEELIIEESKHEALEEMYFWPAVREHLAAGNTLADTATGQEQDAKHVLADLDKLGPATWSSRSCSANSSSTPGSTSRSRRRRYGRGYAPPSAARRRTNSAARSPRARRPLRRGLTRIRRPRPGCSRPPGPSRPRPTRRGTRSLGGAATE